MTAIQIQKRNGRSQQLKAIRLSEGQFAVESSQGKIMYLVGIDADGQATCTCADYARNIRIDPHFRCKHILAVTDCEGSHEDAEILQKRVPRIDNRFIKNINGRDFCLYAGLLDYAHQKGLLKLQCEIIQLPGKDNEHEAICKAVAETKHGDVYQDIGDANSRNTNKMISAHIIRMASTRAKARCLRDLCNIGMTCLEELGDLDEVIGAANEETAQKNKVQKALPKKQTSEQNKETPSKEPVPDTRTVAETDKQVMSPDTMDKTRSVPPPMPPPPPMDTTPLPPSTESKENAKGARDNKNKGNGKDKGEDKTGISEAQKRATINLARRRGISPTELQEMIMKTYGVTLEELTMTQASGFIRELQSVA